MCSQTRNWYLRTLEYIAVCERNESTVFLKCALFTFSCWYFYWGFQDEEGFMQLFSFLWVLGLPLSTPSPTIFVLYFLSLFRPMVKSFNNWIFFLLKAINLSTVPFWHLRSYKYVQCFSGLKGRILLILL